MSKSKSITRREFLKASGSLTLAVIAGNAPPIMLNRALATAGTFGVEGIRDFDQFRAAHPNPPKKTGDLPYAYNITNGVYDTLRNAGHECRFYWGGTDVWEIELRSEHLGGLDASVADNADLFFIATHGNHMNGTTILAYNSKHDDWLAKSTDWRLGDHQINWLAMYSCSTINRDDFEAKGWSRYQHMFYDLHLILGAYHYMYFGLTTDECGEDFAENLVDGDNVKSAWISGVSDWAVDNHPAVLSAERQSTYDDSSWDNTTMERDHYYGHGSVVSDIRRDELYWLGLVTDEG